MAGYTEAQAVHGRVVNLVINAARPPKARIVIDSVATPDAHHNSFRMARARDGGGRSGRFMTSSRRSNSSGWNVDSGWCLCIWLRVVVGQIDDAADGALRGVRVLDLTHARAGPTCTRQLSDLGAEVITVGNPNGGENLVPQRSDYHNLHRGKRSILLDLRSRNGRDAFLRMCETADIVVENFRPQVKFRLGIDPESLWKRNPGLIYASISGYGQTGPAADRPGVDPIVQALSGLMSVTGPPGSGPCRVGIAISDVASGTFLTQGILAALFARERTGKGQWVTTSILEAMIDFMEFQALRWLNEREIPVQAGNQHPNIWSANTFQTADGFVTVCFVQEAHWKTFFDVCGTPSIASDPKFLNADTRTLHREAVLTALAEIFRQRTTAEWMELLISGDIPAQPVLRMDEVFADEQVEHLDLIRSINDAHTRTTQVLRHPVTMSGTPTRVIPTFSSPGEHTIPLLREHGYSDAEINNLISSRAVATQITGK